MPVKSNKSLMIIIDMIVLVIKIHVKNQIYFFSIKCTGIHAILISFSLNN